MHHFPHNVFNRIVVEENDIIAYTIAATTGSALAFVEVWTKLTSRPTLRNNALWWWIGRLLLDGAVGALGLWGVRFLDRPWPVGLVGWVLAGAAGAGFVRARVFSFSVTGSERPVGPALLYEPFRDVLQSGLDMAGGQRDAIWLQDEVLPALQRARTKPEHVGELLKRFIGRMPGSREVPMNFIKATVDDPNTSDSDKLTALVEYACTLRAFKLVKSLHAKALSKDNRRAA
jgi:hypothetical protein